jgi:hypothetical protein
VGKLELQLRGIGEFQWAQEQAGSFQRRSRGQAPFDFAHA